MCLCVYRVGMDNFFMSECVCVCYYYTFRQHTHLESLFFQFYFYFFMYETYFLVHINVKDFFGFVLFLYTFIHIRVRTEFACFVMWGFVYNNFFCFFLFCLLLLFVCIFVWISEKIFESSVLWRIFVWCNYDRYLALSAYSLFSKLYTLWRQQRNIWILKCEPSPFFIACVWL